MKLLLWLGLAVLVLGLLSLVIAIPQSDREGFTAGGMSVTVQTQHSEKVSPIISAVMILGGAGMMVAGRSAARGLND